MQAGGRLGLCWDAMVSATHSTCHGWAMGQDQTQRPTLLGPFLPGSPSSSQRPWAWGPMGIGQPWVIAELRGVTPQEEM